MILKNCIICFSVAILFALLFSYFIINTRLFPFTPQYTLTTNVEDYKYFSSDERYLYLRGKIVLPDIPNTRMGIQFVAKGEVKVVFNEKQVGLFSGFVNSGGVVDLTTFLKPGLNILAIRVSNLRATGNTFASIQLNGWYSDSLGRIDERVISTANWKSNNKYPEPQSGGIAWYSSGYQDDAWRKNVNDREGTEERFLVNTHPLLYKKTFDGSFIATDCSGYDVGSFKKIFRLESGRRYGYLRIITSTPVRIAVNGFDCGGVGGNKSLVQCIDITKYIRSGQNEIQVHFVTGAPNSSLYLDGLFFSLNGENVFVLESDGLWTPIDATCKSVLSLTSNGNNSMPLQNVKASPAFISRMAVFCSKGAVCFVVFLLMWMETKFIKKRIKKNMQQQNKALCLAWLGYLIPLMLLSFTFLLVRDYRINDSFLLYDQFFLAVLATLVALKGILYFELKRR